MFLIATGPESDDVYVNKYTHISIEFSDLRTTCVFKKFFVWKRLVDIFVSFPLAMLSIVLVFLAAICIKLEDQGPIFISQTRLGKFGKRISFEK